MIIRIVYRKKSDQSKTTCSWLLSKCMITINCYIRHWNFNIKINDQKKVFSSFLLPLFLLFASLLFVCLEVERNKNYLTFLWATLIDWTIAEIYFHSISIASNNLRMIRPILYVFYSRRNFSTTNSYCLFLLLNWV